MPHFSHTNSGAVHPEREWFAFRVRPRHEKRVAFHLREKQVECFLPLVRADRTWGKRSANIDLPLFSGYVFCRSHRFGMLPILTTPGIVSVIRAGNSPVPVSSTEIAAIERAVKASVRLEPCPYVEMGERVEITRGPLT
jgi:transcription antitermination factor NusG